ncbi:MAG: RidA family protein [Rhodothermaceae bacterium]
MTRRINIVTGSKWEKLAGFSRLVRIDNIIEVAGTTAGFENGKVVGGKSAYKQTISTLTKIGKVLLDAGATTEDVIRTRIYVTDKKYAEEVAKAHKDFFKEINPAATLVVIQALAEDELLVEIEATAVV